MSGVVWGYEWGGVRLSVGWCGVMSGVVWVMSGVVWGYEWGNVGL